MSQAKESGQAVAAPGGHLKLWLQLAAAMAVALPGPLFRLFDAAGWPHPDLSSQAESVLFGISILAAATILVWASEVAEQMISATLALAALAIVAVLPEYAVDLFFAWTAPDNPENAGFALANMTGANRLLVGLAWPLVFFLFWYRERKPELRVGRSSSLGVIFLGAATIYSFSIPFRQELSLIDSGFLISLFVAYLILSARGPPKEEGPLFGPAQAIGALPIRPRWAVIIGLFAFSGGTVFAAAEPFAEGLIVTGKDLGVDEFILVQWVAPLASEAPEFLLAGLLALRGRAVAGIALLISSKVNQWTLLVGSLPLAFSISDASFRPLEIDTRQQAEVFLTAGQSLFAVAILLNLRLNRWEAGLMLLLFVSQFFFTTTSARWVFGFVYIALAAFWLLFERRDVPVLMRAAREMVAGEDVDAEVEPDRGGTET